MSSNDKIILDLLEKEKNLTRIQICKATGIPWTSAYNALIRLEHKKEVYSKSIPQQYSGRPKTIWYYREKEEKTNE